MAWPNCDKCGAEFHAPYEDGLVECVANLMEQRDEARDELDEARAEAERRGQNDRDFGRQVERAAIVAWLRVREPSTMQGTIAAVVLADAIERGEHLR